MDWEDRIEATIRLPEYRVAYRELMKMDERSKIPIEDWLKKASYLCKQYRLRYPVDPDAPDAAKTYLKKHGGAVQTSFHDLVLFEFRGSTSLDVTIDFTMSFYQIKNEIGQLYKLLAKDACKKEKGGSKESRDRRSKEKPTPWQSYDKNVLENKNPNQIAKEEANSEDNAGYDDNVARVYQRADYGLFHICP